MARPFSSKDIDELILKHKELLVKLNDGKNYSGKCLLQIKASSENLLTQEVLKVLKNIPIDEINREKKGFRIKSLRDYGFNTIADISTASVHTIASVHGISQDAAYSIKGAVNEIVSQARQGVKIKISQDNKTEKSTELIATISRYQKSLEYVDSCNGLLSNNSVKIGYAIETLKSHKGGIKWLFTSQENKQKAINSFGILNELINGEYNRKAKETIGLLEIVKRSDSMEEWKNFKENPISFFNVLEKVNPGVLGTDDSMYGLPEDLAREIQEESFFPDGLLCELRRYQEWGVRYTLHQERVLLGDEMGLGKTIQAIATMVSLRNTGGTHFVVVCPASVITNWCREIRKMSLLSVTKIHGSGRAAALRGWIKSGGVAVTTFETTGHFNLEKEFEFALLVVDEAHYIKNSEARRTINVKNICNHTKRLMFMTGTALENKVEEMISLIQILQPKIASQISNMAFMSSAPQFREKVAPVYYRRRRDDVLTELPDLIENKEWCSLLAEEEHVYEQSILSKHYQNSRRVSWSVDDLSKSSKAKRLLEIIEEAESDGRKIIVFSYFLDTIGKIKELLGDKCLNPINGSVTPQRRQEIIDEFDKAPDGTVLAAQIQSGGTGLNIQSASVVILCEPQLKPSIENQAISRAYRMGQTRNVLVYRLLCENTVDEKITQMLDRKQEVFDAFANKSVAAMESMEIDESNLGDIIKEEIDRINNKYSKQAVKMVVEKEVMENV
jgi:SNF2 family DNA or RNA helicase